MMAKCIHIAAICWFLALQAAFGQTKTPFQKLRQKFENGQVFHAQFTHRSVDSYTGNKSERSGEIWVAKNAYKIISDKQEVAINGKISRVYDRSRNRVIISKYEPKEDDFAPSRFLNGVDSTYTIKKQLKRGTHYVVQLRSSDPFAMFKKVNITLSSSDIPEKLYVVDTANNKIITTFSDGRFTSRQPHLFDLSYPDSAKIIDMRK